jgi:hypothetical protein
VTGDAGRSAPRVGVWRGVHTAVQFSRAERCRDRYTDPAMLILLGWKPPISIARMTRGAPTSFDPRGASAWVAPLPAESPPGGIVGVARTA